MVGEHGEALVAPGIAARPAEADAVEPRAAYHGARMVLAAFRRVGSVGEDATATHAHSLRVAKVTK